jgi:hypothetical protein
MRVPFPAVFDCGASRPELAVIIDWQITLPKRVKLTLYYASRRHSLRAAHPADYRIGRRLSSTSVDDRVLRVEDSRKKMLIAVPIETDQSWAFN